MANSNRLYSRVVTRCIDCYHIDHSPAHKERGVTWVCRFEKNFEVNPYRAIPRKCPLPIWDSNSPINIKAGDKQ